MKESEALVLVAVLQAAFPRWGGGEATAHLYADRLRRFEAVDAARGVDRLVETRTDSAWPSYAEVAQAIAAAMPRRNDYFEIEEAPPSEEDKAAARQAIAHLLAHGAPAPLPASRSEARQIRERQEQARQELDRLREETPERNSIHKHAAARERREGEE